MKALFISKPLKMEPLGLLYLSAVAKQAGHEVQLLLANDPQLESKVKTFAPDVIGYSITTGEQKFYFELNKRLKKVFDFTSVFGGPHATFFPDIIYEQGVDVVCRGEGEGAFVDLLNGRPRETISNLYVKDGTSFCLNNNLRPLAVLDDLPFPDRSILNGILISPIKHFLATRGCPFNCSYCFNEQYSKLYKGERVRFRSVDSVIQEIIEVTLDKATKFVYFQDDVFILDKQWLREFTQKYKNNVAFPFHCHVRANILDTEKVALLKEAGCYSVHIAAETADDFIRNQILRRNMSREQIIAAAKMLKAAGIKFMMQNIIGLPTGNKDIDLATLELNIKCKPDYAWVSIFQPYPGTKLGEYCKSHKWFSGNFDDLDPNFFDESKLNFSKDYKEWLKRFQKAFAIFVEYPLLYKCCGASFLKGVSLEVLRMAYTLFRKEADKRLYGFDPTQEEGSAHGKI